MHVVYSRDDCLCEILKDNIKKRSKRLKRECKTKA